MANRLQKGALNDACRRVAEQVLWTPSGTSADLLETLASKFQEIAERHDEFIIGQEEDPNVITRAVSYMGDVHAVPMSSSVSTQWFDAVLSCLVELAVPNAVVSQRSLPFFDDVRRGIETAEADASN
jgi:hypothetical protein